VALDIEQLAQRIEQEMQHHQVPGFALAVVQEGNLSFTRGFGVTSIEDAGVPVTPHTLFCSGSISKPLTGATIMRLVERGRLDLDAPVVEYLPWLTFSWPDFAPAITPRWLLSHTSGLFGTGGNFGPRDPAGLEAFIREAVPLARFVAPPGKVFEYCNLRIALAAYLAEAVTGKTFPQVVREQLLDPLGMDRTTYDRTVAMSYPVALPHTTGDDGAVRVQHRMFDYTAANPSGQVMASTLDLARLAGRLLNEGRHENAQVLAPASVQEMLWPHAHLHDPDGSAYGLTFWLLQHHGARWVTHGGLLTPYRCELSLFPDHGVAVVFRCNITNDFDPYAIRRSVVDQLLTPPAQPVAARSNPDARKDATLSRYTGTYLSLAAGVATISQVGDALSLEREGDTDLLHAVREDLFVDGGGEIAVGFVPEPDGPPHYFMLDEHPYHRVTVSPGIDLPPSLLETYRGRYVFDDGDTVSLAIEAGTLSATFSWLEGRCRCIPLDNRSFATSGGLIEFPPDPHEQTVPTYQGFVTARRLLDDADRVPASENMHARIFVFLHGTAIMHPTGVGHAREECVEQVKRHDPAIEEYAAYVPIGQAVARLRGWEEQGAEILYVSSHRKPENVARDASVLARFGFPRGTVFFRHSGETYADVARRVMPDIIVEDDCESIGGLAEMTYPHLSPEEQSRITSLVVREFEGIDHLPKRVAGLVRRPS